MLGARCWSRLGAHFTNSSQFTENFRLAGRARPPLLLLLLCSCPLAASSLALVLALQGGLCNVRSARSARPWGACFGALASRCARSLAHPILPQASQTFFGCAPARSRHARGVCLLMDARSGALCLPAASALRARSAGVWRTRYRCALERAGSTV